MHEIRSSRALTGRMGDVEPQNQEALLAEADEERGDEPAPLIK